MGAVTDALSLCVTSVIPALFPFFVCSSLLVAMGAADLCGRGLSGIMRPVFGVSGAGALAVVLGIISGYPVGASCAVDLYNSGKVSKTEAERLIGFCNNSGPLFIIGTVGFAMNGSPALGGMLYIIHIVSAILTGIVLSRIIKESKVIINPVPVRKSAVPGMNGIAAFGNAVARSVVTILNVCGFVVFFAAAESTLPDFKGHEFVNALLEITGGIKGISAMNIGFVIKFSLISFFLALSGLSVFFQTASILSGTGLSVGRYALGKLIQGLIAFVITFAALALLGVGGGYTGAFVMNGSFLPEYSIYAGTLPPLDLKRYLILIGGEIAWCGLIVAILAVAAKLMPETD